MMNLKSRKIYGAMIVLGCGLLTGLGIGITEYFRSKKESVPISSGTVSHAANGKEQKPLEKHFCETLKQLYPDFEKAVPADHAGVYNILNQKGDFLCRIYLEKTGNDKRKVGYAGPIEVALLTDQNNKATGIILGKHQETPDFIDMLYDEGFPDSWNGLDLKDIPDHEVEAVTGATFSSEAIKSGIRHLAADHLKEMNNNEK